MKLEPIIPFEPISVTLIPSGEQWIGQVKWDGVRMLLYYDGDQVRLVNRRLNDRTIQYPELQQIEQFCTAASAILDGELIALDHGKPSFHQIMRRDQAHKSSAIPALVKEVPVTYMIFDVLYVNGNWVTDFPLRQRQQLLESIVCPGSVVQLVSSTPDAAALYGVVEAHGLEGVVVKDLDSPYMIDGKDDRWRKKKNIHDLNAVVGGVTYRDKQVNALLLGLYDAEGKLWYIGHAGAGKLNAENWASLTRLADELKVEQRPFVNMPERSKEAVWLRPQLTVKVNYLQWTRHQSLRQPSIQAITQTNPKACTFGQ
ncbi:RNA ligase family protein [Paenibacillus sp. GCM10012307]|uniref:DNA ligase (ATP) n=1 Tax=Paenibacillus roseus TaxID=2798579 RepID=A0A934J285_9BACL|nr:RNA ligase family protein [Paenibacillus roseus]MBJ6360229.1 DNA ligase [Paenibacillus roseus]